MTDHKKISIDPVQAFKRRLRSNLRDAFYRKGFKKNSGSIELTGLPKDDLIAYLLQTYFDNYGMEWDGVEDIHIDHIIPLATAKTEEDVMRLCHYTNLQLLKAEDNYRKGAKQDYQIKKEI